MSVPRIAVVGAGMGGLVAALRLAGAGFDVVVCERGPGPGGKLRIVEADGAAIDSGPTVLTMRDVFDEIGDEAGVDLGAALGLKPLDILARHAWTGGATLDLHADPLRSEEAIGDFAGAAAARGYAAFRARAREIYETLASTYIRGSRPSVADLVLRVGPRGLGRLAGISPFVTLARALADHFGDPRLRQLFGRYATYCGSSPYHAPATLMLVAHVESLGVWTVEGGMHRIAALLAGLAEARGARFRYGAEVAEITLGAGGATGLRLADGERVEAEAVIAAVDSGAVAAGLLGPGLGRAAPAIAPGDRSLSAVTFSLQGEASGLPLAHHTVFFSDDYPAEFEAIRAGEVPEDPTVYVCAQDRDGAGFPGQGPERLFCILNAPPNGDRRKLTPTEISACETRTFRRLERCGSNVRRRPDSLVATTPSDFAALFPGTGGALYGRASHGWTASFQRPGSRTRIPGLYLAGGSTHPGPGLPMAAISGRLAAESVASDLASTSRSRRAAMRGGMSTR